MIESYLGFDSKGIGTFTRVDVATKAGKTFADFAVKLSGLPGGTLQVPQATDGRIFISFRYKVNLTEVVGMKGTTPDTLSIAEPDPFDQSDPSYPILYDKVYAFAFDDAVGEDSTPITYNLNIETGVADPTWTNGIVVDQSASKSKDVPVNFPPL